MDEVSAEIKKTFAKLWNEILSEVQEKIKNPPILKNLEDKIVKIVIESTTEANKKIIEKVNQSDKKQ